MNLDLEGRKLFYFLCQQLAELKLLAGKRGKESVPFSLPTVIKGGFPGANGQFAAVQYLGGESALKHNQARGIVLRLYVNRLESIAVEHVLQHHPENRTRLKGSLKSPYYEYIFTEPLEQVEEMITHLFASLEQAMRESIGPLFDGLPVYSLPRREWKQKYFNELTIDELYSILRARTEVFVVEQGNHRQELDNYDQQAMHIFLEEKEEVIAYLRVLPKQTEYEEASLGHLLVKKNYRSRGYAKELLKQAVDFLLLEWNESAIRLQTRDNQKEFYRSFGFEEMSYGRFSEGFLHIDMILEQK